MHLIIYYYLFNVSYACDICCCLALFVPLDFALSHSRRHWNYLDGTNSALEWFEQHKLSAAVVECAGAACWCLSTGRDVSTPCSAQGTSILCVLLAEAQQGTCFCKVRRWISPEVIWNDQIECLFVREKITWECWTSSCSCIFMKLLN